MHLYNKKGNKNYKEKKLLRDLEAAISKEIEKNPNFLEGFAPAEDFDGLRTLHNKYCIEDVPYQDVKSGDGNENILDDSKLGEEGDSNANPDSSNQNVDPFNRDQPIIRDYVLEDEFKNAKGSAEENTAPPKTEFPEPVSFKGAFELPQDNPSDDSSNPNPSPKTDTKKNNPKPPADPINPANGDMSDSKKKRSTKRFAKRVVDAVCMLAEKGFVWYANKDINDSKLLEYEMNNEMSFNLLVTMPDGQKQTIKQFFQIKCLQAEELATIDVESKEELCDALYDVMMEKGIAPTPMQELLMATVAIFGKQAMGLIAIRSETSSVLTQLREMHQNTEDVVPRHNPPPPPPIDSNESVEDNPPPPNPKTPTMAESEDAIVEENPNQSQSNSTDHQMKEEGEPIDNELLKRE